MTILEASNKLFEFFSKNHTYCTSKNFHDLVLISDEKELEIATVELALREMEKNELVSIAELDGEKYYILARPLESFEQSVQLSYPIAYMVASTLNEFCELINDYTDVAEVGNITEKDIRNLVILNQHHKAEITKLLGVGSGNQFDGDDINFDNI